MEEYIEYLYLDMNGEKFFTIVLLPSYGKKFPVVVCRSPYVKHTINMLEESVLQDCYNNTKHWLKRGYAYVFQHCRGQGKSSGEFIPYLCEKGDGLAFREWIRHQSFYNGELFLLGGSYTASLHYATAPFEKDVKGAVLEVQDSERYNLWYRNGQMRKGHANWYFGLYKDKYISKKTFDMESFEEKPLKGLSERIFGECAEDFEQMLEATAPNYEFWRTRLGGSDTRDAITNANIPILLTTGYNDFYVGGVFKMWNRMNEDTKSKSALLVSPYNHGDSYNESLGICFENGTRTQAFGTDYQITWFDNIRNGTPLPFKKGVITYYRAFENKWKSDFYAGSTKLLTMPLGKDVLSFEYNPLCPPSFREEGCFAENFDGKMDVVTVYTRIFEQDIFVKGQIKLKLAVSSSCLDTSFYVRISIKKQQFTYTLRHDITSLCYQLSNYSKDSVVTLDFCFDEYAFLIKKGERLRIDISSTDNNTYVCHTNKKGKYYLQTETEKAKNSIYLENSYLILPIET